MINFVIFRLLKEAKCLKNIPKNIYSSELDTCTLQSVANKFNLHPNYLIRYIKENTGYGYKVLIQEQRINKACFLLLNTNLSIEEISLEIGYKNYDFFYKNFERNSI